MHPSLQYPKSCLSLCLIASACLFLSCGVTEEEEDLLAGVNDIYAGYFLTTNEYSVFRPCIEPDMIWDLSEINDSTFSERISGSGSELPYIEFRGTPGESGEYPNFFVIYNRQVTVDTLISLSPDDSPENECSRDSILF